MVISLPSLPTPMTQRLQFKPGLSPWRASILTDLNPRPPPEPPDPPDRAPPSHSKSSTTYLRSPSTAAPSLLTELAIKVQEISLHIQDQISFEFALETLPDTILHSTTCSDLFSPTSVVAFNLRICVFAVSYGSVSPASLTTIPPNPPQFISPMLSNPVNTVAQLSSSPDLVSSQQASSPQKRLVRSSTPNLEHQFNNLHRGFRNNRSLDVVFQFDALGLRLSLGFGENYEFRYDNIGIQVLRLNPAPALFCRIVKNISSPPASSVYFDFAAIHPTIIIITTPLTTTISTHAPHVVTTPHTSFAVSFITPLIAIYTVQECGFARFARHYVTIAFPTHYAVSSIDGSSQSWLYDLLTIIIVQECRCASSSRYYVTAAHLSHYAVSIIDGSSQSQSCGLRAGAVTQRLNYPTASCLLSDVCSHMFGLKECDDSMLRSPLATTCWARHGNVEFRDLEPFKPSDLSLIFILSVSLEMKLELEIHLVSSVSIVGFKAEYAYFSDKSGQIGPHTLIIVYGSGASHLKFLPFNIAMSSNRCVNVVFDYQLFLRTIAMGTKVELPFGFFHFAELDSPRNSFIYSCFVMSFSFFLPSSMAPGSSASAVNIYAP